MTDVSADRTRVVYSIGNGRVPHKLCFHPESPPTSSLALLAPFQVLKTPLSFVAHEVSGKCTIGVRHDQTSDMAEHSSLKGDCDMV